MSAPQPEPVIPPKVAEYLALALRELPTLIAIQQLVRDAVRVHHQGDVSNEELAEMQQRLRDNQLEVDAEIDALLAAQPEPE